MEVRTKRIQFNRHKGSGPRTQSDEVVFSGPVTQAAGFIKGFDVAFSPDDDHHLGKLDVRVETTIDSLAPQRVNIEVTYGLRDWSGSWDDNYEGEVFVTVIGE